MGIDRYGLNDLDRRILRTLAERGKPVGLEALAAILHDTRNNLVMAERYLMSIGALGRSARGREITRKGSTGVRVARRAGRVPAGGVAGLGGGVGSAPDTRRWCDAGRARAEEAEDAFQDEVARILAQVDLTTRRRSTRTTSPTTRMR